MARCKLSARFGMIAILLAASTLATVVKSPAAFAQAATNVSPLPESAASASLETPKPAAEKAAVVEKSGIRKVWDRILSLDFKFGFNFLDVDLLPGLSAALGYRYATEPSYENGYHWRMDRITPELEIDLPKLLGFDNVHYGIDLNHHTELTLVRSFKSQADAKSASPFGYPGLPTTKEELLRWLPWTADRVLHNLGEGEIFSFRAYLNLLVDANSMPLAPGTPLMVATHYLVSGEYQISIAKGANQKVEMRLVALRKEQKGWSVTGGFEDGHKVIGLRIVDRRIENLLNVTEMFRVAAEKTSSSLQMAHYRIDMKDPRVQAAYNGMLTGLLKFKTVSIANPLSSVEELTGKLISDITPFDTIYREEVKAKATRFTVERKFKGKNDAKDAPSTSFKVAPIFFSFVRNTEYFENLMAVANPDESYSYYRLHTYKCEETWKALLSYYKEVSTSSASLLFDSDDKGTFGKVHDISFEWRYRDKSLTTRDLKMVKDSVKQAVPESIYGKINWGSFAQNREFANVGFKYRMVINPEALESIRAIGQVELYLRLAKYLESIPAPEVDPQDPFLNDGSRKVETVVDKYMASLNNISLHLSNVLTPTANLSEERKQEVRKTQSFDFAELRFNDLFVKIGPGFLTSLMTKEELNKFVRFEVTMSADDVPAMTPFEFGVIPDRKVYDAAAYIQSVLTADEFDMVTQMMKATKQP